MSDPRDRWETDDESLRFLERIRSHVEIHGHHVTLVTGGESPRFAYTVGLNDALGHELILAGATSMYARDVFDAIDLVAKGELPEDDFALGGVHASWAEELLLGAYHFYAHYHGRDDVTAAQLIPRGDRWTVDVPDLSQPLDAQREPVWRWLTEPWDQPFAPDATAVTDIGALRGKPISEAARWEDGWEMFAGAGPDIPKDDTRVVPLSTLLGFDPTLEPVVRLEVGRALWRDPPGPWQPWGD